MKSVAAKATISMAIATSIMAAVVACSAAPSGPTTKPNEPTASSAPSAAPAPTTDQEELDMLWEMYVERDFPGEARPDVQLVRYTSPRELAALKVECLNAAGFPDVQLTADNAITYGAVPAGQELALGLASYICSAQYLVDPIYRVPLSAEQLGALHDYYVADLIPCLAEKGYPITDVPSKETFVANYLSEGWSPYMQAGPLMSPSEWTSINEECPQWPTGFYGF